MAVEVIQQRDARGKIRVLPAEQSGDVGRYKWRSSQQKKGAVKQSSVSLGDKARAEKKIIKKKEQSFDDLLKWLRRIFFFFFHPRLVTLGGSLHTLFPLIFSFSPTCSFRCNHTKDVCCSACCSLCPPGSSRCYGSRCAQCCCFGQ